VVAIPPKGAAAHVLISIFLLMAAVAVLPLLWLLLRERGAGQPEADDPARVYAAQFHEVARDRARGAIDAEAASTLEAEIGRRLLAASRGAAGTGGRRLALGERVIVGLGILIVLPAGAFAWYEGMGGDRRALADAAPPGIRQGPSAPDRQGRDAPHDMAESATRLAERLEAEPDNLEGWLLLARSYTQLGRSAEAARAYRRIAGIASAPPARLASIAEDLIAISAGTVSPEALDLLRAANRRDPARRRSASRPPPWHSAGRALPSRRPAAPRSPCRRSPSRPRQLPHPSQRPSQRPRHPHPCRAVRARRTSPRRRGSAPRTGPA